MTITIKIDTGNAAFVDNYDAEIVRILNEWLLSVARMGLDSKRLHDYNGNTVGSITVRGK